ncbi:MAG: hypothetical protein AAGI24_03905 [Pseudomonadota bacterium]
MGKDATSEDAISIFAQEEVILEKTHRLSFVGLAIGLMFIGMFVYFQVRASEIAELSAQMNIQADSEGVRALLELVDRKIELLRSELGFRYTWLGIIGGGFLGWSVVETSSYKAKRRKIRVMQQIASRLGNDS